MGAPVWRLRAAILVLLGAVGVHEAVYALAAVPPDEHAHAYLSWLTPALFGLLAAAVCELLVRACRLDRRPAAPAPRGLALWPPVSALLLVVFAGQEAAEALLTSGSGHAHALTDLAVAHGLWVAAPVSLVAGGVVALLLRGAAAVEAWALAIIPSRPHAAARPDGRRPAARPVVVACLQNLLARNLASRPPPLAAPA